MSALRERIEIPSRLPESLSYNYEGIADVGLQQFLSKFEEIIQKEPGWPIKTAKITSLIPKEYYDQKVYNHILQNKNIDFIPTAFGKLEYYADKDQARVFAAVSYIYYRDHKQDSRNGKKNAISHTREALGSHHLAQLLNEPNPQEKAAVRARRKTEGLKPTQEDKEVREERNEEEEYESEMERTAATVTNSLLRPSDIIPNFDADQLAELKTYNIPKIERGLKSLKEIIESGPYDEEHSTAQTGITPCVVNSATFIHAANLAALGNKELFANFDIQQTPTNSELSRALKVCLAYLKEYTPKINNLRGLFLAIKQHINQNEFLNQTPQIPANRPGV